MPSCEKIKARHRQVCIGDMRWLIDIYTPIITPPNISNTVDYSVVKPLVATVWAAVKTFPTEQIFDGMNTSQQTTHEFYIRWRADVTDEKNIRYPSGVGQYYNIVYIEDLENRHEFLLLRCNFKGLELNV